jgi:hypothetical protein
MDLLTAAFEATRLGVRPALGRSLCALVAVMGAGLGLGLALEAHGGPLGTHLGRAVGGAVAHGGFMAFGWLVALEARPGWARPALRVGLALLVAFGLSRLGAWGALALLGVPLVLVAEARRHPELARLGLGLPASPRQLLVGAAAGLFLGGHMLLAATGTLGYTVAFPGLAAFVPLLAYDIGANALSAEWLFRGALFSHWWRAWGFWGATALSTSLSVARYLADPALPRAPEVGAGAVLYVALLGVAGCGFRAWSGSLLPGYLAALVFFACYRSLAVW